MGTRHTNPKWQGGLIISADLPAIICGPTRDFMRDNDCDNDYKHCELERPGLSNYRLKRPWNY